MGQDGTRSEYTEVVGTGMVVKAGKPCWGMYHKNDSVAAKMTKVTGTSEDSPGDTKDGNGTSK